MEVSGPRSAMDEIGKHGLQGRIRNGFTSTILALTVAAFLGGCGGASTVGSVTQVKTALPSEAQGDANSGLPAISGDGRFVAFKSDASNLVLGATNGSSSIYLKDTLAGVTSLVSSDSSGAQGKGDSSAPSITSDGRLIAFESAATNLVPGDSNNQCLSASGLNVNCVDIFLKDTQTGATTLVSIDVNGRQANGDSTEAAISADGRVVAFRSTADNLVPGDTNKKADIFIKDPAGGQISRVSTGASGQEADGDSDHPAVSANGRFVAFSSAARNLTNDDTNGQPDVFLKDVQTGTITRVSTAADGSQGNGASGFSSLAISADGRFVAFDSGATNLVPGDTNGKRDIFLKDTQTGAISRVSTSQSGQEGAEDSYSAVSVSANAQLVVFTSDAANLVPGDANGKRDVFLKNMATGAIVCLSTGTAGVLANGKSDDVVLSADGSFAAFDSEASNLVPGDTLGKIDVFIKEIGTGDVKMVSTSSRQQ